MPRQTPLVPEVTTPETALSACALTALVFSDDELSPAQEKFNALLRHAEALAQKIDLTRKLTDSHRIVFSSTLHPLQRRRDSLRRDMIIWLDQRLKSPGLTAKQQRLIHRLICAMAADFAIMGDEAMIAMHDAHSEQSFAEIQQEMAGDAQAFFEQMMGESLGEDQEFETVDEVLHARIEQLRQQSEARAQAKANRKARRAKSARQQKAEQVVEDAESALRTIYRQLASALHPDRETDPDARKRKTQLMSETNTAYGRRDLLALLQLQLQANLSDAKHVSKLAQEKISALTALLEERTRVLERELRDLERHIIAEFVLPASLTINALSLQRHMVGVQRNLQSDIDILRGDLLRVRNDAAFKRWLKEKDDLARDTR